MVGTSYPDILGGGRTHNLRLRRPALYPIELRGHKCPSIYTRRAMLCQVCSGGNHPASMPLQQAGPLRSRGTSLDWLSPLYSPTLRRLAHSLSSE